MGDIKSLSNIIIIVLILISDSNKQNFHKYLKLLCFKMLF